MVEVSERAALAGRQLQDELARPRLTVDIARLYSQYVRLRTGQGSLRSFTAPEAAERLIDAVRLTEASLAARMEGSEGWRAGLRRVGELLEWLAHPETNPEGLPLTMLGSTCYELAGYPARAASLATRMTNEQDAPLLRLLLQHDFQGLLELAAKIAANREDTLRSPAAGPGGSTGPATAAWIHDVIVVEVASALGVVAAELRWGGSRRTSQALEKLRAAAAAAITVADPYEWLLLRLSSEAASEVVSTSLRNPVTALSSSLGEAAQEVFERYVRFAYLNQQITVWPSQARGLRRVAEGGSFALCTPTGSGKTRVAEVALLAGLFETEPVFTPLGPLCLYIVPTRSLAAEVEARFSQVLRRAGGARAVTVTGLYGGTDWGPTDEWILSDQPAVLICTQEKCEALVRFAGDLLLPRLRVVIVDEAHEVQHRSSDASEPFESRALRLESLVSRLRARLPRTRFIAMSAVAQNLERPLSRWISGDRDPDPVTSEYRSTRQLVGRLRCSANRTTRIEYDVLDGEPLAVGELGEDAPYVPQPFLPHPPADGFTGANKGMAPFALWAAIQLASASEASEPQTVLISVVEGISNFIGWCTALLEDHWRASDIPEFFSAPPVDSEDARVWQTALRTTEDLFGSDSRELRLLRRGIVVHHGRMPGRLPRILVEVVERRIARVVIATSTLTQGVNLPFETILIPGLRRQSGTIGSQEFLNLIGRAGRPGVGTEGQALVLMLEGLERWRRERALADYRAVTSAWIHGGTEDRTADSPLAALISTIWERWPGTDPDAFEDWLETTAVGAADIADTDLSRPLDVLDGVLLAALEESPDDVEPTLARVWQETFARYASAEEARLERAYLARGSAVARRFSDSGERTRIYRTSLPPRDAFALNETAPILVEHLQTGDAYWRWSPEERYAYVRRAVEIVSAVDRFRVRDHVGRSTATWEDVLRWWLYPAGAGRTPTVSSVAAWHDFISAEFGYRFAWALTAMLLVRGDPEESGLTTLETAPDVPPAAIWLKELLVWGTLEPVAAFLLSRRLVDDRPGAEELARGYYAEIDLEEQGDPLTPAAVRAWTARLRGPESSRDAGTVPSEITVAVETRVEGQLRTWRVLPIARNGGLGWHDVAGFLLASSPLPVDWNAEASTTHDFVLDTREGLVTATPYV